MMDGDEGHSSCTCRSVSDVGTQFEQHFLDDNNSSQVSTDPTYTKYSSGSISKHKIKGAKNENFGKYASNDRSAWAKLLTPLLFKFGKEHTCVSEVQEATYSRLLDVLNLELLGCELGGDHKQKVGMRRSSCSLTKLRAKFVSIRGVPNAIQPGTAEYFMLLSGFAMGHVICCLKQGQENYTLFPQYGDSSRSNGSCDSTSTSTAEELQQLEIDRKKKTTKWKVCSKENGFSGPPISPRTESFLHPAINCLTPHIPSEPFFLFGMSVRCCELEQIFVEEGIKRTFYYKETIDANISKTASDVFDFLRCVHDDFIKAAEELPEPYNRVKNSHNCMQTLLYSVAYYKETHEDDWIEKMDAYYDELPHSVHLTSWLHFEIANIQEAKLYSKQPLEYLESHLRLFVTYSLMMIGVVNNGQVKRHLKIFNKKKENIPPSCPPAIEFVPLLSRKLPVVVPVSCELRKLMQTPSMQNYVKEVELCVEVRPELLWQKLEQLLAIMLARKVEFTSDEELLLQGGTLIVDCEVRTVVLAMDVNVLKTLKTFDQVQDTLRFIEDSKQPWGRLYVEKSIHTIWDMLKRLVVTSVNFTK